MLTVNDFLIAALIIYCIVVAIANFVMLIEVGCFGIKAIDKFLNPKNIYKNHKVNKFGCVMLTLFYNIFFVVHAIYYWFYKLCTVGRK